MPHLRYLSAAACTTVLLTSCAAPVHERVIIKEPFERVVVRQMPAPVNEVPPPASGPNETWVPGHWVWRDTSWEWHTGHWQSGHVRPMPPLIVEQVTVAPSPAHFWVPGHWKWHHEDWVWVRGHWAS